MGSKTSWAPSPLMFSIFSHGSGVCWSVQAEIATEWIPVIFDTDIHGSQGMNPTDLIDPLTFSLAPPCG